MEDIQFQGLIERLVRIEEKQTAAKEQLLELDEKLFGNGQPGVIDTISGRVSSLERWFWSTLGGGSAVLFILKVLWK